MKTCFNILSQDEDSFDCQNENRVSDPVGLNNAGQAWMKAVGRYLQQHLEFVDTQSGLFQYLGKGIPLDREMSGNGHFECFS